MVVRKDLGLDYMTALHGVQSAVAYEISTEQSSDTSPKQLRVGVNSAMCDHAALAQLLMNKGVITREEYEEAIRLEANRELSMYEAKYAGVKFR